MSHQIFSYVEFGLSKRKKKASIDPGMITKASGTREKQRKLARSIFIIIIIIITIIINNNDYFLNAIHFINF